MLLPSSGLNKKQKTKIKKCQKNWFGSPRLNFEQRHWFRTINHHHESCQGPTVIEVNKYLETIVTSSLGYTNFSTIIYRLFLAFFWHFLIFVFCFLFSPEDGSSMAVEICWLLKNLYRLEIRVKYLNYMSCHPIHSERLQPACLLVHH